MHSVLHAFTHSVVWASVIASAFVALVVTLAVEYLAKPGLEARKDRILEGRRELRTGLKDIKRANSLLSRFVVVTERSDPDNILAEYVAGLKNEILERMNSADEFIDIPESIALEWARIVGLVTSVVISPRQAGSSREDRMIVLKYLGTSLKRFYKYFQTPKWRVRERWILIRRIKSSSVPTDKMYKASEQNNSLPD